MLECDQIEERTASVHINEEIDVAARTRITSGARAEQANIAGAMLCGDPLDALPLPGDESVHRRDHNFTAGDRRERQTDGQTSVLHLRTGSRFGSPRGSHLRLSARHTLH